jgi:3-hydroxyisobutyrate dehydrogenase
LWWLIIIILRNSLNNGLILNRRNRMSRIGFIGLGNMGGPMVRNLIKAGHSLKVFDLSEEAMNFVVQSGAKAAKSVKEAASGVEFVISMLPVGVNVKEVFMNDGVIAAADKGTILIDSSTIDVETAQAAYEAAKVAGFDMIDAPVSGGVTGADAGTLTFMCGGDKNTFEKAKPILQCMGKNIIHCGNAGLGQVTKICNNMLAGINALAASEAMVMGERLGVSRQTLYDVISTSTGRSYIFENFNPMSGVCTNSPANNDFKPGFMAKLMLKDLRLSQAAAQSANTSTPLGAVATAAFQQLIENGHGDADTSSIIKVIDPQLK